MFRSGFSCYFTSLERCLADEPDDLFCIRTDPNQDIDLEYDRVRNYLREARQKHGRVLMDAFERLQSATSRSDFVSRLRNAILVKVAQRTAFRRVLLATTSTELAIKLLSDISIGRGVGLQSEMVSFGNIRNAALLMKAFAFICSELLR